ncbi:MAG: hypothetical protein J6A88_03780 [Oscillospiraceae bacterium]|nr:hypothetical protein [Oscillospiraceae bacterium]
MNGITFYAHGDNPALQNAVERLGKLGVTVADAPNASVTHLLLSVPSFNKTGNLLGGGSLYDVLDRLPKTVTIIGGNLPKEQLEDYRIIDLLQDDRYLAENAAITADCAVSVARQKMNVVWRGCPVLILGWGRIGKCLAQLLRDMGADVTVAARKPSDIAILQGLSYGAEDIYKLHHGLLRYQVIFNTVPQPILCAGQTVHCRKDCLLIELASKPGIEGQNILNAAGLPGKYAPKSSGRLIASSVIRLILGREC